MIRRQPQPDGRLLARNTLLNLVGFGAPMVVALLAVPVLIHGLGNTRFGVLAIAWMLLGYLGELGFGSTTTKFTAEAIGAAERGDVGRIAWTTAAMQFVFGLAQAAALLLATPWLVERIFNVPAELWPEMRLCLVLLAATLPLLGVAKSFRGVLEAGQRFGLITAVRIPSVVANYLLPVAGVLAGWSLPAIFALVLVSRIAVLFAYMALAIGSFRDASWRPRLHRHGVRAMLGFGGWITVSSVVSPLILYLDRFFVAGLMSMAAVTYYAAPYEVASRLLLIPLSVVMTLYPAFSQFDGSGDLERANRLAARSVKAILLVMSPLALLLIGGAEVGLRVWLGPEFSREAGVALQLLGVGVLVNAVAQVPYVLLQGSGRPDLPARFHLLELPLHALVLALLVGRFGVAGAAASWTIRVSLDAVLLFAAAHRLGLLRLPELEHERVVRAAGIVAVAIGAVMLLARTGDETWARLAGVGLIVGIVMLLIWRFGMEPAERTRVASLLRPQTP